MSTVRSRLMKLTTFIFDCDGVLWRGNEILPGVKLFFEDLRRERKNVFFVTNNTTKTREEYVKKLTSFGIEAKTDEIFGAAFLAAYYFSQNLPKGKVYCCGNDAIATELRSANIDHFGIGPDESLNTTNLETWMNAEFDENVSDVLIGFDPYFNYTKVLRASSYIGNGANFIVTNEDAALPIARRELTVPGVGALAAAVRKTTGKEPHAVCGKPSTLAFDLIQSRIEGLKPDHCVMFGDRLDTDIVFGKNANLTTVLTLTGVTNSDILAGSSIKPDIVIQNFTELLN